MKPERSETVKRLIDIGIVLGIIIVSAAFVLGVVRYVIKKDSNFAARRLEELGQYEELAVDTESYIHSYSDAFTEDGTVYLYFNTGDKYIQRFDGSSFSPVYIKGVNIGTGMPGHYPGDLAADKEAYLRWFDEISKMNANCIRVYTLQMPIFYEALSEFNETAENPLYLMQGTWFNDELLAKSGNMFDQQFVELHQRDSRALVDIIHGNCRIDEFAGGAWGIYYKDVSRWVIGWLIGSEVEADYIKETNTLNADKKAYQGEYFTCGDVSACECFWAEAADYLTSYEMERYAMQRPVSFVNGADTDILEHTGTDSLGGGSISLNAESIKPTNRFKAGVFASYNVYPYRPAFMYMDSKYAQTVGENGESDPYKGYLEELRASHSVPVLVSEYGLPAGRGLTQVNPVTDFNEGRHSEAEQGEMLSAMAKDIYDTGCAGGLITSWQDEWYKHNWKTGNLTDAERRPYWRDAMTPVQQTGLLEFVPGKDGAPVVTLDGSRDEWSEEQKLMSAGDVNMYLNYDSEFLYFMFERYGADWENEKLTIPLDILPDAGSNTYWDFNMDNGADFIIELNGREDSRILVHEYYDRYPFAYHGYLGKELEAMLASDFQATASGAGFHDIKYLVEKEISAAGTDAVIPEVNFNAGALLFGSTVKENEAYNTLADYYFEGDILELRIPWQLINFRDPSTREIEWDFREHGELGGMKIDEIYVGFTDKEKGKIEFASYTWPMWDEFPYFERLRQSYYDLQEVFLAQK
ncbi:MAG: hypothetical protein J6O71_03490 [Lachnospiraceae bacterium]|nr:hypothetical protein [Lachnospiraceae bacterium]